MKKKKTVVSFSLIGGLGLVICLSLFLNIYGIKWGLPDEHHFHHSFHPDETASLIASISALSPQKPLYTERTGLSNGPMHFYIIGLIYKLIYGSQLESFSNNITAIQLTQLYLTGRIVAVLMSAGCALLIFFITRRYLGSLTALLSALFFVVLPATVTNSHYFRLDIPSCFWVLLAFWAGTVILETKSGHSYVYILGGIFAASSILTKYNSFLILLPLFGAHVIQKFQPNKKIRIADYLDRNLFMGVLAFFITFAIIGMGIFLYWNEFRELMVRQLDYHTSGKRILETMELGSGWIGYFMRILPFSLGWPMLILTLLGLCYAFWRRTKLDILLLLWIVPYYLLIGRSDYWLVRYTVLLMPFVAIFAARVVIEAWKGLSKYLRYFVLVAGGSVFVFTLLYSLVLDKIMAAKDPRIMAYDWIDQNISPGKVIGFDFNPAAFFPCIDNKKHNSLYMRMNEENFNLIDYYVANDQLYLQYLRLRYHYPAQARYFSGILHSEDFRLRKTFENTFNLLGLKFQKVDIPHDYLYFMLRIDIYEKVRNPQ